MGRIVHSPQRKSSPTQLTINDVAPQAGNSPSRLSSDVRKSDLAEGVFTLANPVEPNPKSIRTGVVASAYSPLPGNIATPRTPCTGSRSAPSAPGCAGRQTSKLNCGTRLP